MSDTDHEKDRFQALQAATKSAYDYLERYDTQPVAATLSQAEARERLVTELPEYGMPSADVIRQFADAAEGGFTNTIGGRFFGYVIGGAHPAGMAADWLAAAWDDAPGTPLNSPFGCAVDGICGEWICELLDLPRNASVGLVTGATMGSVVGIAAARHALLKKAGWDVNADGLFGAPPIRVLIGTDAHPTMHLALRLIGFGSERVTVVETSQDGAMLADDFAAKLAENDGPTLVCAQVGQVNTGACDPLGEIGPLCQKHGAWLHIDGAFGLWARVHPDTALLAAGAELADSWSIDAHKWLNTPYDCGFAIVRDNEAHQATMSISASYLPQQEGARDPSHFVPELSRRGRGHAVYTTIRALGRTGIQEIIENCCTHARAMRDNLTRTVGVLNVNDVVLNQALFRFYPTNDGVRLKDESLADTLTKETVRRAVETGDCWVQTAEWHGQTVMRFSVCSHATTKDDIDRTARTVLECYQAAKDAL